MNAGEKYYDVSTNMRLLEILKSNLLTEVAHIYDLMAKSREESTYSDMVEVFSDIILTSYLLGKQMGINYNILDFRLEKKIKICLSEEKMHDHFLLDLNDLVVHLSSGKRLSG